MGCCYCILFDKRRYKVTIHLNSIYSKNLFQFLTWISRFRVQAVLDTLNPCNSRTVNYALSVGFDARSHLGNDRSIIQVEIKSCVGGTLVSIPVVYAFCLETFSLDHQVDNLLLGLWPHVILGLNVYGRLLEIVNLSIFFISEFSRAPFFNL